MGTLIYTFSRYGRSPFVCLNVCSATKFMQRRAGGTMGVTASTATLSRQSYILERVGVRGRLFA